MNRVRRSFIVIEMARHTRGTTELYIDVIKLAPTSEEYREYNQDQKTCLRQSSHLSSMYQVETLVLSDHNWTGRFDGLY